MGNTFLGIAWSILDSLKPFTVEKKSLSVGNTYIGITWSVLDNLKPFLVGISIQNIEIKREINFYYNYQETCCHIIPMHD